MRHKLLRWSKTPIFVPRPVLTLKYIGFVILGIFSALAGGIESINRATFEDYTFFWSYAVIAVSFVATVSSFREGWERHLEKWSALLLFGLLSSWSVAAVIRAFAEGDLNRVTGAFAILLLSMLPGTRAFGLLRKWGVK